MRYNLTNLSTTLLPSSYFIEMKNYEFGIIGRLLFNWVLSLLGLFTGTTEPRDSSLGNSWKLLKGFTWFQGSLIWQGQWASHYAMLSKLWWLEFHLHQYLECLRSVSGPVAKLTVSGLTIRLTNFWSFKLLKWQKKKADFPKFEGWTLSMASLTTLTLLSQSITQYPGRYLSFSFKLKPQPTPIYSWNLLLHLS